MKNPITAIGFCALILFAAGACQLESVSPDDKTLTELRSSGEDGRIPVQPYFFAPFDLDVMVDGPDCQTQASLSAGGIDDPNISTDLDCIGPFTIEGKGYGYHSSETFRTRVLFTFNPALNTCSGTLSIHFGESGLAYDFSIAGNAICEGSLTTADQILLPLHLTACSGPVQGGAFNGYLYLKEPVKIITEQDEMVGMAAFVKGTFSN